MRVYFDTSYLVRLYLEDHGFQLVRQLAAQHQICCSRHGRTETTAAMHRVYREGRLDYAAFKQTLAQFEHECAAKAYHWLTMPETMFLRAETIFSQAPATVFLRAADAMHLAAAQEYGFTSIYSHDRHLLAAASQFSLQGIDIIPPR